MSVKPYTINIDQAVLDDLHQRLGNVRFPRSLQEGYGVSPANISQLVDYWLNKFDWRKAEVELNKFDNFTAEVDGNALHFIHQKSKKPNAPALLLVHGWPDSFYRFHKVLPLLEEFDVVVPSLPGFGFSGQKAFAAGPTADLMAKLMKNTLGYTTFVAASGDIGTEVLRELGRNHADVVTAIHLTDAGFPTGMEDFSSMSKAEQEFAGKCQQWWYMEGAYNMLQSTKPQTLGYGLSDSPVGLLAWIVEKFQSWTDPNLKSAITKDELLTNVTLYWVTNTINSAIRTYAENTRAQYAFGPKPAIKVEIPTNISVFPHEMVPTVREWAERNFNVARFVKLDKGGHFAAMEVPKLYADEIKKSFER